MLRSWWPAGLLLAAGIVLAVASDLVWFGVAFVALAFVLSPMFFPRSLTHAAARERSAADGRPIIYWRPGCRFCLGLRLRLGPAARKAHWVNIWQDPQAAAAVRAIADGNETVPTVVAGDESRVNPDLAWVLSRVR
jgi:mycoredoxin